ncbi:Sec-independent protein translocase subunit TatA [Streptomyces sp. URMC 129]|uniref:Sec-independent protein translocase subunit TatA n=1 Tax=Streptomyces sp. URMC 129 TaxID=3423407 RepID=UPI003F1CBA78
MGSLSLWHILLVALVVVVVFGSKRLPDTARSLGKSMRILKSEASAMKTDKTPAGTDGTAPGTAPRTIEPAPGDTAAARPVDEPKGTTQG